MKYKAVMDERVRKGDEWVQALWRGWKPVPHNMVGYYVDSGSSSAYRRPIPEKKAGKVDWARAAQRALADIRRAGEGLHNGRPYNAVRYRIDKAQKTLESALARARKGAKDGR